MTSITPPSPSELRCLTDPEQHRPRVIITNVIMMTSSRWQKANHMRSERWRKTFRHINFHLTNNLSHGVPWDPRVWTLKGCDDDEVLEKEESEPTRLFTIAEGGREYQALRRRGGWLEVCHGRHQVGTRHRRRNPGSYEYLGPISNLLLLRGTIVIRTYDTQNPIYCTMFAKHIWS